MSQVSKQIISEYFYPSTVSKTPTTLYSVGGEMNCGQDFVVKWLSVKRTSCSCDNQAT
ncbi:hypothetical protein [Crinalium epipsammum]|uniref:hypothetical protein n=1 Tax=Crinalium epipsammum TaxID=241425 RepID=UPI0012F7943D|nr:hypothetical protein [Crinalium epipsammum]